MLKNLKILILIIISLFLAFSIYTFFNNSKPLPHYQLSIFSWSSEEITLNRTELVNDLIAHNFNRIFQTLPDESSNQDTIPFVLELAEHNIDVYALSGSPEWALDSNGEKALKLLNKVVKINQQLPENKKIKGFVIDVEPYLIEDFEWDDKRIQQSFLSGIQAVFNRAEEKDLELIVVVPYFYDTKGYKNVLTSIIHEASSEIAVMNYYRDSEIKHLSFEAREAKRANKPLTTIYEFIPPGKHDLTEKNTYYFEGVPAAKKNAKEVINHYHDQTIHIAFHDYHSFREVINRD